jgi:hypothetical protein
VSKEEKLSRFTSLSFLALSDLSDFISIGHDVQTVREIYLLEKVGQDVGEDLRSVYCEYTVQQGMLLS